MSTCDPQVSEIAYLLNFEFIKAFTCTYFNAAGALVAGLLVYGGVSLSIYIRTDSVLIPTVLLFVTGGAVLSQVAAPGMQIAGLLLATVGAGAVAFLYRRMAR
jgi:hypothetical protein